MHTVRHLLTAHGAGSPGRRPVIWLAALLATAQLAASPVWAQSTGDPVEGRRLATAWCSDCHQVGARRLTTANDAVPSYQAIAAMPSTTAMSIRVFLSTSHQVMPNFNLTDTQISDVAAYILSLRGRRPE
ncbi:MAG: c-type cytochrome [Rubritepida sp.]|nr:c-type cytochrome [Rubritepida sp.]